MAAAVQPGLVAEGMTPLITFLGHPEPGLQPGVDLCDNADLLEILDEEETVSWRGLGGEPGGGVGRQHVVGHRATRTDHFAV
jgi:hypothetical protein